MKKNVKKGVLLAMLMASSFLTELYAGEAWSLLATQNNVTVSYQRYACKVKRLVYLKIENQNDRAVTVSCTLWGETAQPLVVYSNETVAGSCNSLAPAELAILIPEGKTLDDITAVIVVE